MALVIACTPFLATVKVFVLIGQSNMEGHGLVNASDGKGVGNGTLEYALDHHPSADFPTCNTTEAAARREGCNAYGADLDGLRLANGAWKTWPNVLVDYYGKVGPTWGMVQPRGPLSVGFGFDGKHMGPELGFGVEMDKLYGAAVDILLLKVAWGGTSLAKDWRPPSSAKQYGGEVGWCYTNFTKHVHSVLTERTAKTGTRHELVGVVWHQGWNDGCSASMVAEYERNLANLIRDIRLDLSVYGTPLFSIPVSGLDSFRGRVGRRNGIIHAQYAVTQYAEFKGSVAALETRGFVRFYEESGGACNQGYHFNCNGETYFYVGTVAGQGMARLLNRSWVQPYINTTNPEDDGEGEGATPLLSSPWSPEEGCEAVQDGDEAHDEAHDFAAEMPMWARVGAWHARFGLYEYADRREEEMRTALVEAAIARGERLSPYTDRTEGEYARLFPLLTDGERAQDAFVEYPFTPFPETYVRRALREGVDWRTLGAVTPVKSQGPHGVCGTFGQTQAAESQYHLGGGGANPHKRGRPLTSFSEQQVLSCKGGGHSAAYVFYKVGLESTTDYPFNVSSWQDQHPPPCRLDRSKIVSGSIFSNKTSVPRDAGEAQLAAFIHHNGPMQVGISSDVLKGMARAGSQAFVPRESCANLTRHGIDHSLGVIGYGTDETHGDYWIIKNSWGSRWADDGFVYLPRGFDGGAGWSGFCGHFMASGAHVYTMGNPSFYYE